MKERFQSLYAKTKTSSLIFSGLVLLIVVYGIFTTWQTAHQNTVLKTQIKTLELSLQTAETKLAKFDDDKNRILGALGTAQAKSNSATEQLDQVTKTMEIFQRIAQTDPQLLQKYSKVYFLNENYKPSALTQIDTKYLVTKTKTLEIHDRIWTFLWDLLHEADQAGAPLLIVSAYRSFGTQASLKSAYKVTYGSGTANKFSADQGYSEHQLGTTIDFSTPTLGTNFEAFAKTKAYTWLLANAYRYGFIMSYPANNGYYVYEPWHWRFVGLDLAKLLHDQNKNFYDLDQRAINVYQATFFNGTTSGPLLAH
ncbi:MAG: M15 family metallopeptidase [Patescibacteria group bacterium]